MKYTAINIGPIVSTLSLASRPRELWSASYLFSFLMECIIEESTKLVGDDKSIISPATIGEVKEPYKEVGLYPDRVFVKGFTEEEIKGVVESALTTFKDRTGIGGEYVNVMHVTVEAESDKGIIKQLNYLLDCMELVNRPLAYKSHQNVLGLIQEKNDSKLYRLVSDTTWNMPFLAQIATHKLSVAEVGKSDQWKLIVSEERKKEGKEIDPLMEEDLFYQKIKNTFKEEYRSYYKYICVVQADGDNMGKIVSGLDTDRVKELSTALLEYGSSASGMIKEYGGLPIYAGGDDLLFIAPVVSNKIGTIFELIEEIDTLYSKTVNKKVEDLCKDEIRTSMSYGLSISYYKYPLYEALEAARHLLFDKAKHLSGKNSVAWCLRKHSGAGFEGAFTKDISSSDSVYILFKKLMTYEVDKELVSAIAHKLRDNAGLLDILRRKTGEERIIAFYKNFMEEKDPSTETYEGTTRKLLGALLHAYGDNESVKIEEILTMLYGMLRTAKFIKGEGDSDE